MFFNLMIISTLITISSYSWFSMWIGLEINLLSIIPIFKSNLNYFPAEATIKYFITQTLASIFILFTIILLINTNELMFKINNYYLMLILNSSLLTKLGAAPFHSWFPEVSEGLNWMNNLILMTWQKIAPSILLMYNININFFIYIIILSSLVSGIYGLNQTSLRKILAYSSINHISWMLASMFFNKTIWINYFMIYTIISINIIMIFSYFNIFNISQMSLIFKSNKIMNLLLMMNFFSLGGLPPFLGFYPKWLTLNLLIYNNFYFISLILVLLTLMTLYFYTRLMFSSLTLITNESLLNLKFNNKLLIILNLIVLMSLPISMNLYNF
uniref:NADH-ubiquinone oxidoreductase chain 2 n=1 Tax=Chaetocnema scheffleri TaxID=1425543 RepID=A0A1P8NMW1_9CUCU|nr:NADH dehydrogenase subunit 2 [Chaetocnema scheffleri]